jgi:hypothetical protein
MSDDADRQAEVDGAARLTTAARRLGASAAGWGSSQPHDPPKGQPAAL